MLDAATIALINGLGGLKGIGISHPHFYTTMVEWSLAFGGVPIHLHAADKRWMMRPGPSVRLWEGDTLDVLPDVTLIRCGGHFPGGTVLHWAKGAGGRGVVCSSDIATVTTARALRVRHDLRALFRSRDSKGRKTHSRRFGQALRRRPQRRL
jgi:glyoxylase-like metal-dependent hydrolase (beta-lactamase superfamily II)